MKALTLACLVLFVSSAYCTTDSTKIRAALGLDKVSSAEINVLELARVSNKSPSNLANAKSTLSQEFLADLGKAVYDMSEPGPGVEGLCADQDYDAYIELDYGDAGRAKLYFICERYDMAILTTGDGKSRAFYLKPEFVTKIQSAINEKRTALTAQTAAKPAK